MTFPFQCPFRVDFPAMKPKGDPPKKPHAWRFRFESYMDEPLQPGTHCDAYGQCLYILRCVILSTDQKPWETIRKPSLWRFWRFLKPFPQPTEIIFKPGRHGPSKTRPLALWTELWQDFALQDFDKIQAALRRQLGATRGIQIHQI